MKYLTQEQIDEFIKNGIPENCKICPADVVDRDCGCESLCGAVRAGMLEALRLEGGNENNRA